MTIHQIHAAIDKAIARIRQPFRAIINHITNGAEHQLAQVSALAGEPLPDVELLQQFGFSSNPPPGSAAIIVPLGGKTTHGIIIATEGGALRIQPLQPGEAVMYNQRGDMIKLNQDGLAEIHCRQLTINAPDGIAITSPTITTTGHLTAQGNLTAAEIQDQHGAKSMSGMRDVFNDHTHKQNGSGKPNQTQ